MSSKIFLLSVLAVIGLSSVSVLVEAKTFTKCELARELERQGFATSTLPNWVCLVAAESSYRTNKIGPTNRNGSKDYGLFQINDKFWCTLGAAGKDCNVDCNDLLLDNITKAATCAKKIFRRHGYRAWYGWRNKCDGKTLPTVAECF